MFATQVLVNGLPALTDSGVVLTVTSTCAVAVHPLMFDVLVTV
jgi:hypothetical protein